jgi:glycosyltransferase involved in cell wall biosynthesis
MRTVFLSQVCSRLLKQFSVIQSSIYKQSVTAVVGMAVYRQDRLDWVEQAVASILVQDFTDFIYVIVIDGAVDDEILTYLIELERKEQQVILLQNLVNLGLSASMNAVIEKTEQFAPRYFFRMDSDDISMPNRFSSQIAYFNSHPEVDVLGTSLIEINEVGEKVGKRTLPAHHGEIMRVFPRRCAINHPTVAIRFSVFSAGYRYNESLKNTQDYFFWTDLIAAGYRFANLPEPLLEFRRVNDFYKRRGLSKSLNEFKARFYTMKKLNRYTMGNVVYAFAVLVLRLMPAKIVKLAYKLDRYLLNKWVRHE